MLTPTFSEHAPHGEACNLVVPAQDNYFTFFLFPITFPHTPHASALSSEYPGPLAFGEVDLRFVLLSPCLAASWTNPFSAANLSISEFGLLHIGQMSPVQKHNHEKQKQKQKLWKSEVRIYTEKTTRARENYSLQQNPRETQALLDSICIGEWEKEMGENGRLHWRFVYGTVSHPSPLHHPPWTEWPSGRYLPLSPQHFLQTHTHRFPLERNWRRTTAFSVNTDRSCSVLEC